MPRGSSAPASSPIRPAGLDRGADIQWRRGWPDRRPGVGGRGVASKAAGCRWRRVAVDGHPASAAAKAAAHSASRDRARASLTAMTVTVTPSSSTTMTTTAIRTCMGMGLAGRQRRTVPWREGPRYRTKGLGGRPIRRPPDAA